MVELVPFERLVELLERKKLPTRRDISAKW
jgi:hypothetical protein